MSARPRLVHEGTSIYDEENDGDENWLDQEYQKEIDFHHKQDEQYVNTSTAAFQHSFLQSNPPSSLANYHGGKSIERRKKSSTISTHIEIGRPKEDDDMSFDDDANMMQMDDDTNTGAENTTLTHYDSLPISESLSHLPSSTPIHQEFGTTIRQQNTEYARMEIDILQKPPLVVIDGANISYAYATAYGLNGKDTSLTRNSIHSKVEPDTTGIKVASSYFLNAGCRCQVVLPTQWMKRKPLPHDAANGNAIMVTEQIDILNELDAQNILCFSPPTDDDDAYAIAMARRESYRAQLRMQQKQNSYQQRSLHQSLDLSSLDDAFILSNDCFRDAISRDTTGELKRWLSGGTKNDYGHRISYSFCDLDGIDQFGDRCLEFLPNPRHILTDLIEIKNRDT